MPRHLKHCRDFVACFLILFYALQAGATFAQLLTAGISLFCRFSVAVDIIVVGRPSFHRARFPN
jgi:hypothetical protein